MSFLNPVNEPVLRFSSTDVDAPQIDYNARVAGDVKAVLKACLVDGYGATESAGWSIVNDVDHVAEFVSPSATMSDYRLGVDDTSASSTTWYYQYQEARTNPNNNNPNKSISYITKTDSRNGWQLLVTDLGFYFIEHFYHSASANTTARLTYFGQIKSGLLANTGANISFFCIGYNSPATMYSFFEGTTSQQHYRLATLSAMSIASSNLTFFSSRYGRDDGVGMIDVVSDMLLTNGVNIVAQQPGIALKSVASFADTVGMTDALLHSRPIVDVPLGYTDARSDVMQKSSVRVLLYLDYWEY